MKSLGTKKILFVGDDLMDKDNGIPTDDQSYIHWLELFETQIPAVCYTNGTCGRTTADVLSIVDNDISSCQPDIVIFSCGINDILTGVKYSTATNNVKKIFNKIFQKNKLGLFLLLLLLVPY